MAELPAIGKDDRASAQQGGYAYRGIEAITGHAQPLFAKHGVVTVPRVRSVDVKDLVVNGKPWTDTTLVVDYTLVGPDGSTLEATCVGIGRDNADKGANKAMTQAFKYLLLQVLCISDAKDDNDGTTDVADAAPEPQEHNPREARFAQMKAWAAAIPDDHPCAFEWEAWKTEHPNWFKANATQQFEEAWTLLKGLFERFQADTGEEPFLEASDA